jgi:hypothetical protein
LNQKTALSIVIVVKAAVVVVVLIIVIVVVVILTLLGSLGPMAPLSFVRLFTSILEARTVVELLDW